MLGTLVGGRGSVGAASVSVSKSAVAIAIRYGAKRRQFGASGAPEMVLLDYQTHQARLMPRLAKTYALHFAFRDLQAKYLERTDETMQEIEVLAAGLKSYASWHAAETIQTARECCGGQGYLAENRFAALKADSDVFSTFEGDNTVLMQLVAKGLLSKLRKEFSDMKFFGLVRYLAQQATTAIAGRNPVTIRLTDASHLRDPAFHAELLEHRLNDVLTSLAKRMKKRIDAGMDSFQAFVACQNHALDVSFAYIEHQVLLRFQEAIARCEVEHIREVLQELQVLYALDCISRDAAWFLENDYMEGNKARAIRKQMEESCVAIRERAILLVESFGIPDELLAAPIAMGE
jgi:acyl-CoA oxidase